MSYTIDIDTGGTFTDGFMTKGEKVASVKVFTTPHDLTQCIMDCIHEGASQFGLTVEQMLGDTELIRYSTTVGTNTLLQKNGPRIGLLVSKGAEKNVYKEAKQRSADNGVQWLVSPEMIRGISESTDAVGTVKYEPDSAQVLEAVEDLLALGAKIIVVSFGNSYANSQNEELAKKMIRTEFPRHYLGSIPLMLASQVSSRPGDYARTCTALLNAYIHHQVAGYLYKAEEDVRSRGYGRPLLIIHSSGGAARVAKTIALQTYNSGPVAGLVGASFVSQMKKSKRAIAVDIGGTSADMGIIHSGNMERAEEPAIEGLPIHISMIGVESLGSGGGSIAWIDDKGKLQVGPKSAGAFPGPVSFGLGGTEPTVTDADLVLGFINPDFFLGGRKRLNAALAEKAISEKIAKPLGIPAVEAAFEIVSRLHEDVKAKLSESAKMSFGPAADYDLIVYGGAGPTHCCWFDELPEIRGMIIPLNSSVFSAFGASRMDVLHTYSVPVSPSLAKSGPALSPKVLKEELGTLLPDVFKPALRDMRGEGFDAGNATWEAIAQFRDVKTGERLDVAVGSGRLSSWGPEILKTEALGGTIKTLDKDGRALEMERLVLNVKAAVFKPSTVAAQKPKHVSRKALKGSRKVFWGGTTGSVTTEIYDRCKLEYGNEIVGPAIVEAVDATYVIAPGHRLTVDQYLNALIKGA